MDNVKVWTRSQDDKEYVGVLISTGYGAGWSSWNTKEMAYDRRLVKAFIAMDKESNDEWQNFYKIAEELYPDAYLSGMRGLELRWVERGRAFKIKEYDGFESLMFLDETEWITL